MNNQGTTDQDIIPLGDLQVGQHVVLSDGTVLRLAYALPWRCRIGAQTTTVHAVMERLDGGQPSVWQHYDTHRVQLATEEQVAAAAAEGRRRALADALTDLASLIVQRRLPLPEPGPLDVPPTLTLDVPSREDLQAWANALDVPVDLSATDMVRLVADLDAGMELVVYGPAEPGEQQ